MAHILQLIVYGYCGSIYLLYKGDSMKKNVGSIDQKSRLLAGSMLVLIGLFVPMATPLQVIVFVVAAIAFITGFVQL